MIDITCFNWIKLIQKSNLGAYEKSVAHYLSTYMNQNQDVAWPSQSRMFGEMGIGKSTLNRALNTLESKGWLVRERGCSNKNTRYLINVPTEAIQSALEGSPTQGLVPHRDEGSPTQGLQVVPQGDTNNKVITKNNKKKKCVPPTLEECIAYATTRNATAYAKDFFDYYSVGEWHDMYGNKIQNWKQKFINYVKREQKFSGNGSSTKPTYVQPTRDF